MGFFVHILLIKSHRRRTRCSGRAERLQPDPVVRPSRATSLEASSSLPTTPLGCRVSRARNAATVNRHARAHSRSAGTAKPPHIMFVAHRNHRVAYSAREHVHDATSAYGGRITPMCHEQARSGGLRRRGRGPGAGRSCSGEPARRRAEFRAAPPACGGLAPRRPTLFHGRVSHAHVLRARRPAAPISLPLMVTTRSPRMSKFQRASRAILPGLQAGGGHPSLSEATVSGFKSRSRPQPTAHLVDHISSLHLSDLALSACLLRGNSRSRPACVLRSTWIGGSCAAGGGAARGAGGRPGRAARAPARALRGSTRMGSP